MRLIQVLWFYILWHYTKAWHDLLRVISNYLWFIGNYFSISLLLRTLFSPWRRLSIKGGKGQQDSFFGALLINTLMRVVGFIFRIITILAGAFVLLFAVILSVFLIALWLVLPIFVFFLFFGGLGFMLNQWDYLHHEFR